MQGSTGAPDQDVLILGGGVIGLCCAHELLLHGRSVTVLDAQRVGAGASHGNCGTITPSHAPLTAPGIRTKAMRWLMQPGAPLYVRPTLNAARLSWLAHFSARCGRRHFRHVIAHKTPLMLAGRAAIEQLVADARLDCEFEASGTMYVWREEATYAAAEPVAEAMREAGVTVEALDGPQMRAREPSLNTSVIGGHYHPGDARLRPDRYVAELARCVRQHGGHIAEGASVTGFETSGDRIGSVVTSAGRFGAGEIVFALGAWAPLLGRQLGLKLPIEPGKGYSITYTRPALAPKIPLVLQERAVCVTAWDSGFRLGSTMEFSGYDTTLNRRRLDALKRGAAEYLQQPEGPRVTEEWYGWRPMTYDDLPILGRAPGWKNLTLATGHGMLGVSLSAITGRLIGELLTGRETSLDLQPFSPSRFT